MSQSLDNIVQILSCLSAGINRFSDICREVKLPPSTAHRLLASAIKAGLAIQDPIRRFYYLGPVIFNLASNPISSHQDLIATAADELRWLQTTTSETVAMHALVGIYQTCLDEQVSAEPIKFTIGKGEICLAVFGASGKALLAQLADVELKKIKERINKLNKEKKESNLFTVFSQIDQIRQQGFAESSGERMTGAMVISAPVANYYCPISISVMGPENRMAAKREPMIQALKKSSTRLSAQLLSKTKEI